MKNLDSLFAQIQSLEPDELKRVADSIIAALKGEASTNGIQTEKITICRKCGEKGGIAKFGKDGTGKQRYRCKYCGATFTMTSYTTISHTHCDLSKWEKYVECLLLGLSLEKCAALCKISVRTAFLWRHKILSILQNDQTNRVLAGIVELDETFFSISYKGNRTNSKNFTMPREAYKRGTDSNAQIGSRACVMCAIERNGQVYAEVLGKGQPTIAMLSHAFDSRILNDSIVLSDKAVGARHYFERNDAIKHIALSAVANPSKKFGPPEVRGAFHIQNVNNMHTRLRKFLQPYNGVSTKYLNHYINLFVWLDNHKKLKDVDFKKELSSQMNRADTYISSKFISELPIVPSVA
ncbi:MAG: IS1595 family transposase [Clostridia bacterium]|nr:IS1595 family transposase [Clostridia bacterium]